MQFIDLQAQYRAYRPELDAAIAEVMESCRFINGPQVAELERRLAGFVGVKHGVGMASGTDALLGLLMAWGVGPGDEVITTPFTFIATAEVIVLCGAKPVFVDVEPDTLNIDPALVERAITKRTRGIIPVSLYGQCADLDPLNALAAAHGIFCLEDGCQSFGAGYHGRRSCGIGSAAATSFFPSKPLGCYGDGGMAFTNDDWLADRLRMIREHGQSARYRHVLPGFTGRLDTIQAAVLLAKLPHFEAELAARQEVAERYSRLLDHPAIGLPRVRAGNRSVFAQYTVRLRERERVAAALNQAGIPTAVHYPLPLHLQPVFTDPGTELGYRVEDFPISAQAAREVLSLPMHPFLTLAEQEQVATALLRAVEQTQ